MLPLVAEPALWITVGSALYAAVAKFLKGRFRSKVESAFVRDMATNHLPHIYNALTQQSLALLKIGTALGADVKIDLDNPPPIQFIPEEK